MTDASPRIALRHRLDYRFDSPVRLSTHWLRLRPAPQTAAEVTAYTLRISPSQHFLNWLRDPFENHLARLDLHAPVRHCTLDVEFLAALHPVNPFDFLTEPYAATHPFDYPQQLARELAPYLQLPPLDAATRGWLTTLERSELPVTERLSALNQAIHTRFDVNATDRPGTVDTHAAVTAGSASPRGLAWLLTLALRDAGLAARLVSGYRITGAEPDFHATLHAWAETYLPGAGWVGLDPAAGLFTAEHHIPLATAADALRLWPVMGYREACEETVTETITVQSLVDGAADWPYTGAQWHQIQHSAAQVDARLRDMDLQVSSGTALEFTRPEDDKRPEWRTTGPGADKRAAAERMARRLRDRLLPGAVICTGQGEWFAGESEPRWRISCIARRDGVPVWRDPALLDAPGCDDGADRQTTLDLARGIAQQLDIDPGALLPAHEDQLYQLWRDRETLDFRPGRADLATPEARLALARQLDRARAHPAGHVLPLHRDPRTGIWQSGPWPTRRGAVALLPGDAPMGFRLPLGALPVAAPGRVDPAPAASPWQGDTPLADGPMPDGGDAAPPPVIPTTALCVERRRGRLHVFLPPVPTSADFLALVNAVERAAAELGTAVHLEGYVPPPDGRLQRLELEPETGTLRVTTPGEAEWQRESEWLATVYDEAARQGLSPWTGPDALPTPAGQRAGRHLGGPTPATSPFLRNPGLLGSLLRYWQRHPSLSYLFAGPRIGPDGWAPRLDEGSEAHLHELELALARLPEGPSDQPWLADRVLSHLVTDPTGDPRHGEFRLHRLYPPGSGTERLGLVELHAFAMAPDCRITAAQSLLLRAILARLAMHPETGAPVRWGNALHDRFLLPHALERDLDGVLGELADSGLPLEKDWFGPWTRWMFPVLADIQAGPVRLRLQPALEPWPVLAEESTGRGTMRFIDPANARFQVHLTGLTPNRHALLCNGRRVPLQPGALSGEAIAGIRCKVANPPSTLYPELAPVRELLIEVVDSWTGQALGGCRYELPADEPWQTPQQVPASASVPPGAGGPWGTPPAIQAIPPAPVAPASTPGRVTAVASRSVPDVPPAPPPAGETPYLLDLADPRPGGAG